MGLVDFRERQVERGQLGQQAPARECVAAAGARRRQGGRRAASGHRQRGLVERQRQALEQRVGTDGLRGRRARIGRGGAGRRPLHGVRAAGWGTFRSGRRHGGVPRQQG
ncbi:hypothetical protein [Burkholderia glumae]|uniref:hypothetical protein n=1 Tax=Burkholderia glumae TaxID=337 RepID=UPI001C3D750B|nr:hypothetical protein [Burkholderia glumae]